VDRRFNPFRSVYGRRDTLEVPPRRLSNPSFVLVFWKLSITVSAPSSLVEGSVGRAVDLCNAAFDCCDSLCACVRFLFDYSDQQDEIGDSSTCPSLR